MCGIAGIIPTQRDRVRTDVLGSFQDRLAHRGPDDRGYLILRGDGVELGRQAAGRAVDGDAALVHLRLSILDLSEAGWQPMASADRSRYIVFNGEIYNYIELRGELSSLGHVFHTQSDTEVLLAAYDEWGAGALTRLVGMFAFAILDIGARRLFLARDFFGIKPLYYASRGGGFAFASEIKALLTLPWVGRGVRAATLFEYLRYGLTDRGAETLLADVVQLPPAHYLLVPLDDPAQARPTLYWSVDLDHRSTLSIEDAAEELRCLFVDNVRLHLRSDVPVGAALSGGLDSSAIVTSMRRLESTLDLHTFSFVADDERLSEERWIDLAGRAAGAIVHKVTPRPGELAGELDRLIVTQDEPFTTTSVYAQYRVFQLAQQAGIKVMLDGQGADELLGGYGYHIAARLASLVYARSWAAGGRLLRSAAGLPGLSYRRVGAEAAAFLVPEGMHGVLRHLVGRSFAPAWLNADWFTARGVVLKSPNYRNGHGEILRHSLYENLFNSSLPCLLRYEDRNSMAFSIESRVPFLTPKLASFALSLPESYLIGPDATSKSILRQAMRGVVPDAILDRRDKVGFVAPQRQWLVEMSSWVDRVLGSPAASRIPALNLPEVRQQWQRIQRDPRHHDPSLWRWCNLIEWSRQFDVAFE